MKKTIYLILTMLMIILITGCDKQSTVQTDISNKTANQVDNSKLPEAKDETQQIYDNEAEEIEASKTDENKLIDEDGCIYEVNTKYTFPNSSMIVKRVKLKKEPLGPYLMYFDFDIENTSDKTLTWRIQRSDNNIGILSSELLPNEEIGGNSNLYDDDFIGNRENYNNMTLNVGESYSCYKLGVFDGWNWNLEEPEVKLKESEPMILTLYYKENGVSYPFEIKLNQE